MYTPDEDEIEQDDNESSQDTTDQAEQAPEQVQTTTAALAQRSTSNATIINK